MYSFFYAIFGCVNKNNINNNNSVSDFDKLYLPCA